ncbi:MAG: GWxTD domain-containing protein [Bacteroidetes bacterium]|nr:GWxTD domain-containing protein [Bacteroidota bacterium]
MKEKNRESVNLRRRLFAFSLFMIAVPASSQGLQVDMDEASFAYGPEASLVEVYLAFDAAGLSFVPHERGMVAQLPIIYSLSRSTNAELEGTPVEPVYADTGAINFVVADTSLLQRGQYFVHQLRTTVPPGEYEMTVDIMADSLAGRQGLVLRRDVVIPNYRDKGLVKLSDLALASSIARSDNRESVFYKNGLEIRPNANQLYGGGLSTLFYYVEAYNLNAEAVGGQDYTVLSFISEANQAGPMEEYSSRRQRDIRDPDVIVGSFDISGLPSGSYFLKIAVLDSDNESLVEQSRKFFVYNPDVERAAITGEEVSFESSEFAGMSDADVERAFDVIGVIATSRERSRLKRIEDGEEKRRFLYEFWETRDPNPSTRENEFRDEYYRRVQFADERYASSFNDGWKSDRGHAVLKYGMPSAVDPHLYDRDTSPYEIWEYNNIPGQGQAIFVFADTQGFGNFELVHSTVSGERRNPDWITELRKK